jgi:hypothetical protein
VKVSSNHITTSPVYLTDGHRGGEEFWSTGDEQVNKSHVEWVVVNLDQSRSIRRVNLYPCNTNNNRGDGIPSNQNIQVSDDETTWKTVAEKKNIPHPNGNIISITFPPCKSRCMKVEGTKLRPPLLSTGTAIRCSWPRSTLPRSNRRNVSAASIRMNVIVCQRNAICIEF